MSKLVTVVSLALAIAALVIAYRSHDVAIDARAETRAAKVALNDKIDDGHDDFLDVQEETFQVIDDVVQNQIDMLGLIDGKKRKLVEHKGKVRIVASR